MGIFPRIASKRNRFTLSNPPSWFTDWLSGGLKTNSGVNVGADTAMTLWAVYACVTLLSETVASLPLQIFRKRKDGGKDLALDHWAYPLLHQKPNSLMTSFTWREMQQGHLLLNGNRYDYLDRTVSGRVVEIIPMQADKVETKLDDSGNVYYVYQSGTEKERTIRRENMLHIPGYTQNGINGISVISYQRETLGMALAMDQFGAKFFGTGTNPGAIITMPAEAEAMDTDELKAYMQSFAKQFQGMRNAQGLMVLPNGEKFERATIPLEDLQFLGLSKAKATDICGIFKVPPHMIGILDRATYCLPAGEPVFTAGGPKGIERIKPGDKVWSVDETGQMVLSSVKAVSETGVDDILQIKSTNRTLRCNRKHPVLIRRKVAAPKSGVGGYQCIKWESRFMPAGDLQVGDVMVVAGKMPDSGREIAPNGRKLTEGFMSFLGLLIGDGNVFLDSGSIYIARHKSASYWPAYRQIIEASFVRYVGGNGRGDMLAAETAPVNIREHERMARFSSVTAARELAELGFCLAFVRGYLDADGSVDKKGRVVFHSVNPEMLEQVRHLCISCGVPVTNLRQRRATVTLPNGNPFDSTIFLFTASNPGDNRRIGSYDKRYIERLEAGRPFDRKDRAYPRHGGRGFGSAHLELSRIVSIETVSREPVYDIEVDGTHSFIASGVVVHNSNIEHQAIQFVVNTLRPWLVRQEQALNSYFLSDNDRKAGFFAEFNVEGLLRGDSKSRADFYRTLFNLGAISPNEIRALENLNPVDGGDEHFVQINLAPMSAVAGISNLRQKPKKVEPFKPLLIGTESRALPMEALARQQIANNYREPIRRAAERLVNEEVRGLRDGIIGESRQKAVQDFEAWLDAFYQTFKGTIRNYLAGTFAGLILDIAGLTRDILPMDPPEGLEESFSEDYMDGYIIRHIESSEGQLRALYTTEKEPVDAISRRLDQWEERRPEKIAVNESTRAAAAIFATLAFSIGSKVQWRITGTDTCPYCKAMNGKIVGRSEQFAGAGDTLKPDADTEPMRVYGTVRHPPLHYGCDCVIVAA